MDLQEKLTRYKANFVYFLLWSFPSYFQKLYLENFPPLILLGFGDFIIIMIEIRLETNYFVQYLVFVIVWRFYIN